MDILLIGTGLLTSAYFINQHPKKERQKDERTEISANERPNGENIYESEEVKNQTALFQKGMNDRYDASLIPGSNLVHPNFHAINNGENYDERNYNVPAETDFFSSFKFKVPNTTPKENSIEGVNVREGFAPIQSNMDINPLTGEKYDFFHGNMMPSFAGNQPKQPAMDSYNRLDRYKKPSKTEIPSLASVQPQNVFGKFGTLNRDMDDRYNTSIYHNGIKPFQEEREQPLFVDGVAAFTGAPVYSLRIEPRGIDDLRVNERPVLEQKHVNAGGISMMGQQLPENLETKNRPSMYDADRLGTGLAGHNTKPITMGQETTMPTRMTSFGEYTSSGGYSKQENTSRQSRNTFKKTVSTPLFRNAEGYVKDNVILYKDSFNPEDNQRTEFGSKTYTPCADKPNIGHKVNLQTELDETTRQKTLHAITGSAGGFNKAKLLDKELYVQRPSSKDFLADTEYVPNPQGSNVIPSKKNIGNVKLNTRKMVHYVGTGGRDTNYDDRELKVRGKKDSVKNKRVDQDAQYFVTQLDTNPYNSFIGKTKLLHDSL
jgi:hypothetical protein